MTTQRTTPLPQTGHTLTELFELGWLKIITPVKEAKPPHHLAGCNGAIKTHLVCKRCNFKTNSANDLRKNKGCNAFANYDTNPRGIYWTINRIDPGIPTYLKKEEPFRGCNIVDRSEWVYYPEVGKAWQEDKFINEQVKKAMK